MIVEFCGAPSGTSAQVVEVPVGWTGTTTLVRVSTRKEGVTLALGRRHGPGAAARGIYRAAEALVLVVDGGTGHWLREAEDGSVLVAEAQPFPILEVIESEGQHGLALVSGQEIRVMGPRGVFEVPVHANDGFRKMKLTEHAIRGEAWIGGEWMPFAFNLAELREASQTPWVRQQRVTHDTIKS